MLSARKKALAADFDAVAPHRREWRRKAQFFHEEDERYLRFLIPAGSSILDIGCGTGDTLAAMAPAVGVGIDISAKMIKEARQVYPNFTFHVGDAEDPVDLNQIQGTFDFVLVSDTIGFVEDCESFLGNLHRFCRRDTRVILVYYSHLWQPALRIVEACGLRQRQKAENVLSPADIRNLADLANFESVKAERRLLLPLRLLGIGRFVNRFFSSLPLIQQFALRHYTVCRPLQISEPVKSATIVIPARNEKGNIESAIQRLPRFCDDIEVIFVEGHSRDGTYEEMKRVQVAYPDWNIKLMQQPGAGKADAVFFAFEAARGDVLIILDADLSVPPEQLTKFWQAIASGKAEFVNGSRLVYPMEDQAMRFLNLVANRAFTILFSWLLNQRITDTLCGTKALRRSDYIRLKTTRWYFGEFDPFGDFELIFGASKLGLKFIDIPVRYAARRYGETQISRFRHGLILLRMTALAFIKMKAV